MHDSLRAISGFVLRFHLSHETLFKFRRRMLVAQGSGCVMRALVFVYNAYESHSLVVLLKEEEKC